MDASHKIGVIVSRRESGGFIVLDALGRTHYAHDAVDLGSTIERLTQDEDIPAYKTEDGAFSALEQATIHLVAERLVPENMKDMAPAIGRMAAEGIAEVGKKGWSFFEKLAKKRDHQAKRSSRKGPSSSAKPKVDTDASGSSPSPQSAAKDPVPPSRPASNPAPAARQASPKRPRAQSLRFAGGHG